MTLHATRAGQAITVHGNIGTEVLVQNGQVRYVQMTETAQHVEFLHDQLGKMLAEAKAERDVPRDSTSPAEPRHPHAHHPGQHST